MRSTIFSALQNQWSERQWQLHCPHKSWLYSIASIDLNVWENNMTRVSLLSLSDIMRYFQVCFLWEWLIKGSSGPRQSLVNRENKTEQSWVKYFIATVLHNEKYFLKNILKKTCFQSKINSLFHYIFFWKRVFNQVVHISNQVFSFTLLTADYWLNWEVTPP